MIFTGSVMMVTDEAPLLAGVAAADSTENEGQNINPENVVMGDGENGSVGAAPAASTDAPVKRRPGRPRKNPLPDSTASAQPAPTPTEDPTGSKPKKSLALRKKAPPPPAATLKAFWAKGGENSASAAPVLPNPPASAGTKPTPEVVQIDDASEDSPAAIPNKEIPQPNKESTSEVANQTEAQSGEEKPAPIRRSSRTPSRVKPDPIEQVIEPVIKRPKGPIVPQFPRTSLGRFAAHEETPKPVDENEIPLKSIAQNGRLSTGQGEIQPPIAQSNQTTTAEPAEVKVATENDKKEPEILREHAKKEDGKGKNEGGEKKEKKVLHPFFSKKPPPPPSKPTNPTLGSENSGGGSQEQPKSGQEKQGGDGTKSNPIDLEKINPMFLTKEQKRQKLESEAAGREEKLKKALRESMKQASAWDTQVRKELGKENTLDVTSALKWVPSALNGNPIDDSSFPLEDGALVYLSAPIESRPAPFPLVNHVQQRPGEKTMWRHRDELSAMPPPSTETDPDINQSFWKLTRPQSLPAVLTKNRHIRACTSDGLKNATDGGLFGSLPFDKIIAQMQECNSSQPMEIDASAADAPNSQSATVTVEEAVSIFSTLYPTISRAKIEARLRFCLATSRSDVPLVVQSQKTDELTVSQASTETGTDPQPMALEQPQDPIIIDQVPQPANQEGPAAQTENLIGQPTLPDCISESSNQKAPTVETEISIGQLASPDIVSQALPQETTHPLPSQDPVPIETQSALIGSESEHQERGESPVGEEVKEKESEGGERRVAEGEVKGDRPLKRPRRSLRVQADEKKKEEEKKKREEEERKVREEEEERVRKKVEEEERKREEEERKREERGIKGTQDSPVSIISSTDGSEIGKGISGNYLSSRHQMWSVKYSPQTPEEVIGNEAHVSCIHKWLKEWKARAGVVAPTKAPALSPSPKKASARRKKRQQVVSSDSEEDGEDSDGSSDWFASPRRERKRTTGKAKPTLPCDLDCYDYESEGDASTDEDTGKRRRPQKPRSECLHNVLLLTGPPGSFKTSTVYACAHGLGYRVFEINASARRAGKSVMDMVREATQSHQVGRWKYEAPKPPSSPSKPHGAPPPPPNTTTTTTTATTTAAPLQTVTQADSSQISEKAQKPGETKKTQSAAAKLFFGAATAKGGKAAAADLKKPPKPETQSQPSTAPNAQSATSTDEISNNAKSAAHVNSEGGRNNSAIAPPEVIVLLDDASSESGKEQKTPPTNKLRLQGGKLVLGKKGKDPKIETPTSAPANNPPAPAPVLGNLGGVGVKRKGGRPKKGVEGQHVTVAHESDSQIGITPAPPPVLPSPPQIPQPIRKDPVLVPFAGPSDSTSVILFEDIDILFQDEDRGFWGALLSLAEASKRPIIMTSNEDFPRLPPGLRYFHRRFERAPYEEISLQCQLICLAENTPTCAGDILNHVNLFRGDLRKILLTQQTHVQHTAHDMWGKYEEEECPLPIGFSDVTRQTLGVADPNKEGGEPNMARGSVLPLTGVEGTCSAGQSRACECAERLVGAGCEIQWEEYVTPVMAWQRRRNDNQPMEIDHQKNQPTAAAKNPQARIEDSSTVPIPTGESANEPKSVDDKQPMAESGPKSGLVELEIITSVLSMCDVISFSDVICRRPERDYSIGWYDDPPLHQSIPIGQSGTASLATANQNTVGSVDDQWLRPEGGVVDDGEEDIGILSWAELRGSVLGLGLREMVNTCKRELGEDGWRKGVEGGGRDGRVHRSLTLEDDDWLSDRPTRQPIERRRGLGAGLIPKPRLLVPTSATDYVPFLRTMYAASEANRITSTKRSCRNQSYFQRFAVNHAHLPTLGATMGNSIPTDGRRTHTTVTNQMTARCTGCC